MKSYLRVQVKQDDSLRRSNRTATSRRHLLMKHGTERTERMRAQNKGQRRNQESRAHLSLIHSDPFYLENSSRKGRSISWKARRGREREGGGGSFLPAGHSGRYLDRTVNPDSEEKTLSKRARTHQWAPFSFVSDAIVRVVFGTGTSILVPLIISKMEIRAGLGPGSYWAIFNSKDRTCCFARVSRLVER